MVRSPSRSEEPRGLVYQPDFISADEEADLIVQIEGAPFETVTMHGQTARRTVRHHGRRYSYGSRDAASPTEPLPAPMRWLRDRCAELAGIRGERFEEALVTRYPPGAGIGWHRDAPMFGSRVAGVSLLSPSTMRFQRRIDDVRLTWQVELAPRSAYILGGAARWAWQHTIPPTKGLRYSVTFRTIRE